MKLILRTDAEIELWTQVYAAVMAGPNIGRVPELYADSAVELFRERQPEHEQQLADEMEKITDRAYKIP